MVHQEYQISCFGQCKRMDGARNCGIRHNLGLLPIWPNHNPLWGFLLLIQWPKQPCTMSWLLWLLIPAVWLNSWLGMCISTCHGRHICERESSVVNSQFYTSLSEMEGKSKNSDSQNRSSTYRELRYCDHIIQYIWLTRKAWKWDTIPSSITGNMTYNWSWWRLDVDELMEMKCGWESDTVVRRFTDLAMVWLKIFEPYYYLSPLLLELKNIASRFNHSYVLFRISLTLTEINGL